MLGITPLAVGSQAPQFSFGTATGEECSSSTLLGKPYVLFFYPKDNTPGCTKEACAFRDHFEAFEKAGVSVIGVSGDSLKSHDKFRQKYELPFGLVADEDRSLIQAFGVWGDKKFMGKVFAGIHRITFVIDAEGKVAKVYPKVKPAEHAEQILEDLAALGWL